MIGYIEGKILKKEEERVLILANQIGYEVLLPAFVMDTLNTKEVGDEISLYIFYQLTERQPKPVLIGFNLEVEKEFFQLFVSVEGIGPLKAVKALTIPVRDVAGSIEDRDVVALTRLKGIGNRVAQKIIASLEGKMGKFALIKKDEPRRPAHIEDFTQQVFDVLVKQLGHRSAGAKQMITSALKRNQSIATPEELFDEVYRGEKD